MIFCPKCGFRLKNVYFKFIFMEEDYFCCPVCVDEFFITFNQGQIHYLKLIVKPSAD